MKTAEKDLIPTPSEIWKILKETNRLLQKSREETDQLKLENDRRKQETDRKIQENDRLLRETQEKHGLLVLKVSGHNAVLVNKPKFKPKIFC